MTTNDLDLFANTLRAADVKDDAEFKLILEQGVDLLRLVDRDIAHEFEVSVPTVTRWRNGDNAPHPAMRKHVFAWLLERATTVLKREQAAQSSSSVTCATESKLRSPE